MNMKDMQQEIEEIVGSLDEAQRLEITKYLLTVARCFEPGGVYQAAMVIFDGVSMQITGVNTEVSDTVGLVCNAHAALHKDFPTMTGNYEVLH